MQSSVHPAPAVSVPFAGFAGALVIVIVGLSLLLQPAAHVDPVTQGSPGEAYGRLPVSFVPNKGQIDGRVKYYAQGGGYSFYFTERKAVLALTKGNRRQVLDLAFLGANPDPRLVARRPTGGTVNYLRGSDRSGWQTGMRQFERVIYRDLWPGIDMVFFGRHGKLTYEFHLRPGADPSRIRLAYRGADDVSLGANGTLLVHTTLGTLADARPKSFQPLGHDRQPVASRFVIGAGAQSYGFAVGPHDSGLPLVIDPGLAYSTYLGGNGADAGQGITADSTGSVYVTGTASSSDFPTTAGVFDTSFNGGSDDLFVAKLNPTGSALEYSTYLGGSGTDYFSGDSDSGRGIAVDSAGSAYVTGYTYSSDFPVTAGSFDTSAGGGFDGFVSKLDPTGSALAYSTYLGGNGDDRGSGIAVDGAGSVYVTGATFDPNGTFPTTPGAFDTGFNGPVDQFTDTDVFVTKLNSTGSALVYSTYLGGAAGEAGAGIAIDDAGSAYVTGPTDSAGFPTTPGAFDTSCNCSTPNSQYTIDEDAFVTKLSPTGAALAYSTYLGGEFGENGTGIAVDDAGSAYVVGTTASKNFPTTPGAFDTTITNPNTFQDAYVTKLSPAGSALAYSTYLGGETSEESGAGIALDNSGHAFVTGSTRSSDFPTTAGAVDTSFSGGVDAYVTKLNQAGSALGYSTYLGGPGGAAGGAADSWGGLGGIAVDDAGGAYLTGLAGQGFPTTPGAFDTTFNTYPDAYVAKLDLSQAGYPRPKGATPMRVALVPAYQQCTAPDRQHGPPLAYGSCSTPAQESTELTVGSAPVNMLGFVRYEAVLGNPSTPADEADIGLQVQVTDVREQGTLADYGGEIEARATARLTDRTASEGDPATAINVTLPLTTPCTPTAATDSGSTCSLSTTLDTLIPGAIEEGQRSVLQFSQVHVVDGGPDGDTATEPNTVFLRQGIFVP